MFKKIIIALSLVLLLNSSVVYAGDPYPNHSKLRNDITMFEQKVSQHVLIPTWLPPKYKPIFARITRKTHLTITYSQGWEIHDGEIELQVNSKSEIKETHLSKIKLENGTTAYFKEERLEGPFDNVPFDGDYVRLYFYDNNLLYTLGMGSKAINTAKMKRILIKIANSMT
ncbi:hypothetical protein M3194_12305 [Paenibacillus glycanilyticus]|uniref:hypothetical protein n=1 Tax=Paenibacillus glycanilyticus TaxID=126569 RepID=UPI00203D414E|nr:hypothetical protein [Paenibacillus glycanilyticus]MCM3628147.1 hypothetical protein [Paenibacillus glycanilyticus]